MWPQHGFPSSGCYARSRARTAIVSAECVSPPHGRGSPAQCDSPRSLTVFDPGPDRRRVTA